MSSDRRCLLAVHAHPDDEASKGAGTVARYRDEGVRSVLVCATGGEAGDILNPAMDRPEVRERLPEVRREELARATSIIGYRDVVLLGYRDSGMPDSPENADPRCFARADLDEATGRLVEVIRQERPQVLLTYDEHEFYPHPDHVRVHEASVLAYERAADPAWYPDAGDPWAIGKLYFFKWSLTRMQKIHAKFGELGLESPFDDSWFARPWDESRITTTVEVGDYYDVRKQALLAHATQVDPASPFWFGLPDDVLRTVHPYEDYELAHSRVDASPPETDLFAGL